MSDRDRLLPPAEFIHRRLTRNQLERRLLRSLLRLVIDAEEIYPPAIREPRHDGREVNHA
jgi:hypothetical protein